MMSARRVFKRTNECRMLHRAHIAVLHVFDFHAEVVLQHVDKE